MFSCKSAEDARKRIPDKEHKWVRGLHELVDGDGSNLSVEEGIKGTPASEVQLFTKATRESWSQQLLDILRSIQKELE